MLAGVLYYTDTAMPVTLRMVEFGPYVVAVVFALVQLRASAQFFLTVDSRNRWGLYGAIMAAAVFEIVLLVMYIRGAGTEHAGVPLLVGAFGFILAMISSFSVLFRSSEFGGGSPKLGAIDSIYFTIVTFTTLGFGDITPKDKGSKIMTASLVMTGYLIMPILIALLTANATSP